VHNTGGPKPTRAEETTDDQWSSGFHQLFESVIHLNQAFIPGMKERLWGRIVNVTSLSVLEPIPNLAVSNAMRSAATAMLKTLSDELAAFNICINCMAPGVIHTDRTEERLQAQIKQSGGTREQYLEDYVKSIPAGRLGTAEEFAAMVAFLCSQRASYITGSTICVDGGKRRATY
jgi:3-oxoacyl-[acyl-carrier protein] reductase